MSLRDLTRGIIDAPLIDTPAKKVAAGILATLAILFIVAMGAAR